MSKINFKDHITSTSSVDVKNICQSFFKQTGISVFQYHRIYNDGHRFMLGTDALWIEHYFEHGHYNAAKLDRHPSCFKQNYYLLWDNWRKDSRSYITVGRDAEYNFNSARGFSVIKPEKFGCDIFEFTGTRDNWRINEFYVHNIDKLESFIAFFKDRAKPIIDQAHRQRFLINYNKEADIYHTYPDTFQGSPITSVQQSSPELRNLQAYQELTDTEKQCIEWLVKGKTIPEIALILGNSHRTVEKHIANIKLKLDSNTLFQLGGKITQVRHQIKRWE